MDIPAPFSEPRPTLLIVDDEPVNLMLMDQLLGDQYRVRAANCGARALAAAAGDPRPDLILLDIMMPEMDGLEVLRRLRDDPGTRDIPVIFLTALAAADDEERGLRAGAVDYITKPIKPVVLRARVRTQLDVCRARKLLQDHNALLEEEVAHRMTENELVQQAGIRALAHLAETRDPETGNHILRTQTYVNLLAEHLRNNARFADFLTPGNIALLTKSAPLHDIGKVGIPDAILQKPGPLNPQEWEIMKTHCRMGFDAIARAEADVDRPLPFLTLAKEIARWHHEKWDGSGYPDGLSGERIPVSARIMAVADVFDAITSPRIYKPALPFDTARQYMAEQRERHFDPDIVDAFLDMFERFVAFAQLNPDALPDNESQGARR